MLTINWCSFIIIDKVFCDGVRMIDCAHSVFLCLSHSLSVCLFLFLSLSLSLSLSLQINGFILIINECTCISACMDLPINFVLCFFLQRNGTITDLSVSTPSPPPSCTTPNTSSWKPPTLSTMSALPLPRATWCRTLSSWPKMYVWPTYRGWLT